MSADTAGDVRGLAHDTALTPGDADSSYDAVLNSDWETFGPCGGYLAGLALRAAGLHSGRARPASINCNFLRTGSFGPVTLSARTLRGTSRSTATEVEISQDDRTLVNATVWTIDDGLTGLAHDAVPAPDVPPPSELDDLDSLIPDEHRRPFLGWQKRVEERTLTYDYENWRRPFGEPRILSWFRFRNDEPSPDPIIDAARFLLLIDTCQFPASFAAYEEYPPYISTSLDLNVQFHRFVPDQEWLLCEATAPIADGGLLTGRSRVWAQDGSLMASGGQQMICHRL